MQKSSFTKSSKKAPSICFEDYAELRRKLNGPPEEDYFCWRWSVRQFPSDMTAGRSEVPQDDAILRSIIESKAFCDFLIERNLFVVNICRVSLYPESRAEQSLSTFLLEVYGDDPEHLAAMWGWAKSSNSLGRLSIDRVFSRAESYPPNMVSFCEQMQRDSSHVENLRPKSHHTKLSVGLRLFLIRMYEEKLQTLMRQRLSALKLDPIGSRKSSMFLQTEERKVQDIPNIIFSVAGSGKTQHLFDILTQFWGHYLVSGRVHQDKTSTQTLLKPRKGSASSDTEHLHKVLDRILPSDGGTKWFSKIQAAETTISKEAWICLFHNRRNTFSRFEAHHRRKALPRSQAFKPKDWLLFQTVCTENFDPFLETFEILILIDNWDREFRYKRRRQVYFCLDEAQCELPDGLEDWQHHSFHGLLAYLHDTASRKNYLPLIAAGTSLQLQRTRKIIEDALAGNDTWATQLLPDFIDPLTGKLEKYRPDVSSNAKIITHNDEFKELLGNHSRRLVSKMAYLVNLEEATSAYNLWEVYALESPQMTKEAFYRKVKSLLDQESPEDCVEKVVQAFLGAIRWNESEIENSLRSFSSIFRGRIRWSTLFIEQLFIRYLSGIVDLADEMDKTGLIENAAEVAQGTIIQQLQARIEELKKKGQHLLLRDLYFTAVRADLMNKPCIFMDTESAQMVTEGFALLKPSGSESDDTSPRQELAEPLTIRAIIRYLRKPEQMIGKKSRHERILEQLLFDVQDSDSAFGEMSEYYLGWAFAGLLSSSTVSTEKSNTLRDLLAKANLIVRPSASVLGSNSSIGSLEKYFLLESQMAKKDEEMGVDFQFDDWLRRIEKGEYFPTIYFPPQSAGPDIVFYLRHKENDEDGVLCALQVKTGSRLREGSYGVIRTLDPNLWFSTEPGKRVKFLNELALHTHLRIITVLVTPSTSSAEFLASPEILRDGLRDLKEWVQRYNVITRGNAEQGKDFLQNCISDAEKDFQEAETVFKNTGEVEQRKNALEKLRSIKSEDQAEGALLVIERAVRWLRWSPEKIRSQGASRETGFSAGHDFFFTVLDQTDLPGIFGDNYAQLSKAMKLLSAQKPNKERKERDESREEKLREERMDKKNKEPEFDVSDLFGE